MGLRGSVGADEMEKSFEIAVDVFVARQEAGDVAAQVDALECNAGQFAGF